MNELAVQKHDKREKGYDYKRLAQLYLIEGKSFYNAALELGMPESTALNGPKLLIKRSSLFARAISDVSRVSIKAESLRPKVLNSLNWHLSDPESPMNIKAAELAGRLKELDMWVRSADVNIGVFTALTEALPDESQKLAEYENDE